MKKQEIVEIHWVDSAYREGWRSADEHPAIAKIRSIGLLIGENDDGVTITSSTDKDGCNISPLSIPWEAIIGYWGLKI